MGKQEVVAVQTEGTRHGGSFFSRKVVVPGIVVVAAAVLVAALAFLAGVATLAMIGRGGYAIPRIASPGSSRYAEELPAMALAEREAKTFLAPSEGPSLDVLFASSDTASASEPTGTGRKIIRDAEISVEVNSFKDASERAAAICEAQGGYVESSSAQASKGDLRSGTIVLRVPAERFEDAIADIETLGRVRSKQVIGRDVTEEYVDLEVRLLNWQQQEKQLLAIMSKATKVSDVLQVQTELGRVREQIERITGRLRFLKSQIAFSKVTLELFEPAVASAVPSEWGFVRALGRAMAAFVNTVNGMVVLAGGIAPVVVLALAAWVAATAIRKRRTR